MGARCSLYGQFVKPTRIFVNGEEKAFLLQQDIGPFLRALGYAYSTSEINRLCSPAVNEGPPIALRLGGRPLRTPDDVIVWAEKRLQVNFFHTLDGKRDQTS